MQASGGRGRVWVAGSWALRLGFTAGLLLLAGWCLVTRDSTKVEPLGRSALLRIQWYTVGSKLALVPAWRGGLGEQEAIRRELQAVAQQAGDPESVLFARGVRMVERLYALRLQYEAWELQKRQSLVILRVGGALGMQPPDVRGWWDHCYLTPLCGSEVLVISRWLAVAALLVPAALLWASPAVRIARRRLRRRRGQCVACGYSLRGLVEQRCPECGKPF